MMPSSEVRRVFVHEGIDAAVLVAVGARGLDEPRRQLGDAAALVGCRAGALGEARHQTRLVLEERRCDLIARRQRQRAWLSSHLTGWAHARVSTLRHPAPRVPD